ncbi:hypothetical protein QBC40DRAFT_72383 [Triangularia verruculosa]|uniref:Nitrogen regulatory protein areA GATA-like domain-containing protein n=1 Tax=Triangularia verruculosa TaxID=2587418 RepID=A0AAN6XGQ4_9PEZI|nr:hypothetical protein QBC40DRAFT_72383 [Triangularia verruculosa]
MEAMAMAMLLPKGIVENTREIYKEVASYPIVPPEKLWQYWNVYTTTSRKLVDPTAYRLEHFWWHVWGSNRRYLSGPTLARLFEDISNGPTFVPLRSNRNRYEGPHDTRSNTREPDRRDSKGALQQDQPNSRPDQQRSAPVGGMKLPTPSSSRPPPAHPILKKTRGPSGTRPRPTARFVDPSAFEEVIITPVTKLSAPPQLASSPQGRKATQTDNAVAAATAMPIRPAPNSMDMPPPPKPSRRATEMPPPPKPSSKRNKTPSSAVVATQAGVRPPPISPARAERAAPPTGKRILASTAKSKRRPVMSRRQSSQSSGGTGTRVVSPATAALVKQVVAQTSKAQAGAGNQDSAIVSSSTESQGVGAPISEKSAGKRPANEAQAQRATAPHNVGPLPNQADGPVDRPLLPLQAKPGPQIQVGFHPRSTWDANAHTQNPQPPPKPRVPGGFVQDRTQRSSFSARRSAPMMAGFVTSVNTSPLRGSGTATAPKMVRSRSNNMDNNSRLSLMAMPTGVTSAVATTTTTTARGQFDSEPVTIGPVVPEARDIPDSVMSRRFTSNRVLEPCFTPTPPNPAPPIPFGRSKSQLHLLLEREKMKKGDLI